MTGTGVLRSAATALAAALALGLGACANPSVQPTADELRALAPTGKLRVGLALGSPSHMLKDPQSGDVKGVGYELGQELARRLGAAFEPVTFTSVPAVLEGLKAGRVDLAFTNATPVRARDMDFSQPYLFIESGFLVPSGSPITTMDGFDRTGMRIGVIGGSSSDAKFTRELKSAELVRAGSSSEGVTLLTTGRVDLFATNKAQLYEMSDRLPGSRVLAGRYAIEQISVAIPKGRDAGLPFVRRFVEAAVGGGLVADAVRRAGLRGTTADRP